MKSVLITVIAAFFSLNMFAFAQHPVLAHPSDKVIFLRWQRNSKNQLFNIYRRKGSGEYKKINHQSIKMVTHRSDIIRILGDDTPFFMKQFRVQYPEQIHITLDTSRVANTIAPSIKPCIAIIRGCGYLDSTVIRGETYTYRITVTMDGRESIYADQLILTARDILPLPPQIRAKGMNERICIYLKQAAGPGAGYDIYRSQSPNGTYKQINELRIFATENVEKDSLRIPSYVDEAIEVGKTYWYKAAGVDVIGNHGQYTQPVRAVAYDSIPPEMPTIKRISVELGRQVHIFWDHPDKTDVEDFHVYRSETLSDLGRKLRTTRELKYVDTQIRTGKVYWYRIAAIDKYGNEAISRPHIIRVKQ